MTFSLPHDKTNPFLRNGVVLFFCWVLAEGILRKWVAPGLSTPIFFIKYAIICYLVVYFVLNREKVYKAHLPYIGILFFYLSYCFLQLFNLDVTDKLSVGAIGIAVHLGFMPLIFLIPKVITHTDQFAKIIRIAAWIALPIFILGIVQYFSPAGSLINRYVAEDMDIALVGSHVRITTIFSYLAGHGSYLVFVMPFLFIYITTKFDPNHTKLPVIVIFMLGLLNLLMTGSRSPVAFFTVDVILLFLGIALGWGGADAKPASFIPKFIAIIVAGVLVVIYTESGNEAFKTFAKRTTDSQYDVEGRVIDQLSPFKYLEQSGLIGFGIGTAYEANQKNLTGRERMPAYWEEESERIVIELGLIGFILCTLTRLGIFAFSVKTMFTVSQSRLKQLAMIICILELPALIYFNQAIFNWLENVIFWTGAGLISAISQIDQHEKQKTTNLSLASR